MKRSSNWITVEQLYEYDTIEEKRNHRWNMELFQEFTEVPDPKLPAFYDRELTVLYKRILDMTDEEDRNWLKTQLKDDEGV